MRAQATAHQITLDRVDLDALDKFLRSDRAPPDSMMLSDLDGYLTGIAIGPGLVLPSEWLPPIWGGDGPDFADLDEASAILASIMGRYNEILREIDDDALAPVFWTDRKGTVIAMDWAEGFRRAIRLRADAWKPLFVSERDGKLLLPILSLCRDRNGDSLLGLPPEEEDRIAEQAPELIPGCVIEIAAFWRRKGPKQNSMPFGSGLRSAPRRKQGRPQRSVSLRLREEIQEVLRS